MTNAYTSYELKYGKQVAKAVILSRPMAHTAIMRLAGNLGPFRAGNIVKINFNTLEMRLVK